MRIQDNQLESWKKQGAQQASINSHKSIRDALSSSRELDDAGYEVYLQGSYKNHTNIRRESDVDVVVHGEDSFFNNLTDSEKRELGLTTAAYGLNDFRRDVLSGLRSKYGSGKVKEGNKAVQILLDTSSGNYVPADVIICVDYSHYERRYGSLEVIHKGMAFLTNRDGVRIVNYPKQHFENGNEKSNNTGGRFREMVRIFKNARVFLTEKGYLKEGIAPSYFIECCLYNVPDRFFTSSLRECADRISNWIQTNRIDDALCQNGITPLFGNEEGQWSVQNARTFFRTVRNYL